MTCHWSSSHVQNDRNIKDNSPVHDLQILLGQTWKQRFPGTHSLETNLGGGKYKSKILWISADYFIAVSFPNVSKFIQIRFFCKCWCPVVFFLPVTSSQSTSPNLTFMTSWWNFKVLSTGPHPILKVMPAITKNMKKHVPFLRQKWILIRLCFMLLFSEIVCQKGACFLFLFPAIVVITQHLYLH